MDLFGYVPAPKPPQKRKSMTGHAWPPSTGPAGKTCSECKWAVTVHHVKTSMRCELMRRHWARLAKPDIKGSDPACLRWAQKGRAE